jgi:pimeloyl-ACP methyl ester carboxylesterase
MERLRYEAPGGGGRILLVMLPGVGIEAGDFAANGFCAAVHERGLGVDIVAVRPELELYLEGDIAVALHDGVIAPGLAEGFARVWLLGISLGGFGALLYAQAYPGVVEGIVLLAPFLGTQGAVAEVAAAGGIAGWREKGSTATARERLVLGWLRDYLARPALYLGYGMDDRFARGHALLGAVLPAGRVFTQAGGHDWECWAGLWSRVLDAAPFAGPVRP